jgi:hypothetical protein
MQKGIGRIDPSNGNVTQFSLPQGGGANAITAGPDGDLWFTIPTGRIGKIDPSNGAVTEFAATNAGTNPSGIASGPDGAVWFPEGDRDGNVSRIDPSTGTITHFQFDVSGFPDAMASGPDDALWFTEGSGSLVGRIGFDAPPSIPPLDDPSLDSPENLGPVSLDSVLIASTNTYDSYSAASVRYFDGVVRLDTTDLQSFGFGTPWGQSLSWTNGPGYAALSSSGNGTVAEYEPYLLQVNGLNTVAVILSGTNALYYDYSSGQGSYFERFGGKESFTQDPSSGDFLLSDTAGDVLDFYGFDSTVPGAEQGQLKTFTDAAGNVTDLSSRTSDGEVARVTRSSTIDGTTVAEAFVYAYVGSGVNQGLLQSAALQRQTDGGSWVTVRSVEYDYYDGSDSNGNAGDLKTAKIEDAAGCLIDEDYYRYYTPGEANGYTHGLKFFFSPASFARLSAAVPDPLTAPDTVVAPYADDYFQYDGQHRITEAVVQGAGPSASGGLGTFNYSYTTSHNPDDPNSWAVKTVETLPDGNQNIVFSNASGQLMLKVFVDSYDAANPALAGDQWITFNLYSDQGQIIETAQPSAVTGYDETSPDLLDFQDGLSPYLDNFSGVIDVHDYYDSTTATETTPQQVLKDMHWNLDAAPISQ